MGLELLAAGHEVLVAHVRVCAGNANNDMLAMREGRWESGSRRMKHRAGGTHPWSERGSSGAWQSPSVLLHGRDRKITAQLISKVEQNTGSTVRTEEVSPNQAHGRAPSR